MALWDYSMQLALPRTDRKKKKKKKRNQLISLAHLFYRLPHDNQYAFTYPETNLICMNQESSATLARSHNCAANMAAELITTAQK